MSYSPPKPMQILRPKAGLRMTWWYGALPDDMEDQVAFNKRQPAVPYPVSRAPFPVPRPLPPPLFALNEVRAHVVFVEFDSQARLVGQLYVAILDERAVVDGIFFPGLRAAQGESG